MLLSAVRMNNQLHIATEFIFITPALQRMTALSMLALTMTACREKLPELP